MKLKKFSDHSAIPLDQAKEIKPPSFLPVANKIVEDLVVEFITKEKNYNPIRCPYNNRPRMVHPDACAWHRECQDAECYRVKCKRIM